MFLAEVLKGIDYNMQAGPPGQDQGLDIDIASVSDDSRTVAPKGVFVALEGYAKDGRNFVDEAVSKGASVIVSDSSLRAPEGIIKISVSDARVALASIAKNFYGDPSVTKRYLALLK